MAAEIISGGSAAKGRDSGGTEDVSSGGVPKPSSHGEIKDRPCARPPGTINMSVSADSYRRPAG